MENKILRNVFKNVDYDTYERFDKVSFVSSLYGIINPVCMNFIDFPVFETIVSIYFLTMQTYWGITNFSSCEKYTKEIVEITNLYNDLIDNYVKFNNTFNLEHPIEIYQMYNYMLYNGYLSKDGEFEFGKSPTKDIYSLFGVNVVTGKAVCRHIANMLNDIYNKMNINACTCSCHLDNNAILYDSLNESILLIELLINNSTDNTEKEQLKQLRLSQKKMLKKYKPPLIKKSNHLINIASKNGIGYIMDPTNLIVFKKTENNEYKDILKLDLFSPLGNKIKLTKFNGECDKKREILLLPNSIKEEDDKIITNINNICLDNLDLLDRFKYENRELYNDINDKLIKIKKR